MKDILLGGTPYLHKRAVRAYLEELPLGVREALEGLFGEDLPDPVHLVAGTTRRSRETRSSTWSSLGPPSPK